MATVDSLQNEVNGIQTQLGSLGTRMDNWTTNFQDQAAQAVAALEKRGIERSEFVARRGDEIVSNLTMMLQSKFAELESQLITKFADMETKMQSQTAQSPGGATPGPTPVSPSATSGGGATSQVTGGASGGGYERRRGYLPEKKTVPEEFIGEDLREWRDRVGDMEDYLDQVTVGMQEFL